jgi:hypothetical protein
VESYNRLRIVSVHAIVGNIGEKQLAHRNWLKLRRLASFRDIRLRRFFPVYSLFRAAATKPNYDSREVVNSSLRMRQLCAAWDCFVAVPSWSEYIFITIKQLQVIGSKNNLPRIIREPRMI